MPPEMLPVVEKILSANDRIALENRKLLDGHGIMAVNVMASPGAGKTSLILRSIEALRGRMRAGVIEGDVALSLIHISEPTRRRDSSRMPSSA